MMKKLAGLPLRVKVIVGIVLALIITGVVVVGLLVKNQQETEAKIKEYRQVTASLEKEVKTGGQLVKVCANNLSLDGLDHCKQTGLDELVAQVQDFLKTSKDTSSAGFDLDKALKQAQRFVKELPEKVGKTQKELKVDADKYRLEVIDPLIKAVEAKIGEGRKLVSDNPGATSFVHKPGELAAVLNNALDQAEKDVKTISQKVKDEKILLGQLQAMEAGLKGSKAGLEEKIKTYTNALNAQAEKQAPNAVPSAPQKKASVKQKTTTPTQKQTSKPVKAGKTSSPEKLREVVEWVEETTCGKGDSKGNSWEVPCE